MTTPDKTYVKTIGVDFDGVIHRYSKGWNGGAIYDPPVDGSLGGLKYLMKHYAVFIHTARNPIQVSKWLEERGFKTLVEIEEVGDSETWGKDSQVRESWRREFWNEQGTLLVTRRKYAAAAYIDDRAITFHTWMQALSDLEQVLMPVESEISTVPHEEKELHRSFAHPAYVYYTTEGQKGAWPSVDAPPDYDFFWELNTDYAPDAREQLDDTEQRYWRRLKTPTEILQMADAIVALKPKTVDVSKGSIVAIVEGVRAAVQDSQYVLVEATKTSLEYIQETYGVKFDFVHEPHDDSALD